MPSSVSPWPVLPPERFVPEATAQHLDVAAVAAYLAKAGLHLDAARGARQLAGGLANQNFLVGIDGEPAVLRRPPGGPLPPGAHDMAREHRILSRLHRVLPEAPRSFHFCADPQIIGVPFQLIAFRDGLVVRGATLPPDLQSPAACRVLSTQLIEMLARIHATDTTAIGLDDLGKPQGFYARAVAGWSRRGEEAAPDDAARKAVAAVAQWLRSQPVEEATATLLHCDFKLDNCIIDPATLRIVAVIDWDMGTRGDPLFDLATTMSYWTEAHDPACMHTLAQMPSAAPGFLTRDEAVALYAKLTGRDVSGFMPWRVLAVFKTGVVFQQLYQRWVSGAVRDPRYAGFAALGSGLVEYALGLTQQYHHV